MSDRSPRGSPQQAATSRSVTGSPQPQPTASPRSPGPASSMAAALAAQNLRTVAAPRRASTARPLVRRSSSASSLGRHSPTIEHHHHVKGRVPQMHDGAHGERHDERWERMFRLLHAFAEREGHWHA